MRLQFNPPYEIFFKKAQQQKMKGQIQMKNPTSDTIFAYKIKCTEPDLFTVNLLKGNIKPGQRINITFKTNDPVNLEYARQLASKHKFLVQFTPLTSEHAAPNFKSQQSDRKKYYINMDSIRGSQLVKDQQKMSIRSGITNKDSYISMRNRENQVISRNKYLTPQKFPDLKTRNQLSPEKMGNQNQQLHDKYSKLKDQLEDLHRQRQQIVNKMSSTRKSTSLNLKKIIVFIVCLIIGYFIGNLTEGIVQNYHQELQRQRKRQEQDKPWGIFSIFDFLYDQVDPESL